MLNAAARSVNTLLATRRSAPDDLELGEALEEAEV